MGLWEAEWMFSPESNPDLNAQEQSEEWEQLWRDCFDALIKTDVELEDLLLQTHDLSLLQTLFWCEFCLGVSRRLELTCH